ncbi:DegT/DnrJ/EryC1/StrS family aminotransferase [Candidatus Woesearchaeota archaeon]|nr:DegT/DnrJ/EryC1/StrS family aminotransferase [Candidatus Woesearchaeota archaeon]
MADSKTTLEKEHQLLDQQRQKALDLLSGYTKHKHVKLVHRGNAAILCALYMVKKANPRPFILIPDQGGWLSFKTYPKMLGFDTRTVKTNRGLIDLIDLEKKAESGAALLVTSFAGYFAEQPMSYISKICKRNNCLIIEDASGAVGDDTLCDGTYADIIVGSFGKWKPINVEYGGFISTANKEYLDDAKDIFSATNFYPKYDVLLDKLSRAKDTVKLMVKRAETVKQEIAKRFPELKIIHQEMRGLNVVVRTASEDEKKHIEEYCDEKGFDYVECPQYIRLEEEAISIELKRIEGNGKA